MTLFKYFPLFGFVLKSKYFPVSLSAKIDFVQPFLSDLENSWQMHIDLDKELYQFNGQHPFTIRQACKSLVISAAVWLAPFCVQGSAA